MSESNPLVDLVFNQLASFQALLEQGFNEDEISVDFHDGKPTTLLKSQGREFRIEFPDAPAPASKEAYEAAWKIAVKEWEEKSERDRMRVLDDYYDDDKLDALGDALEAKGFSI